MCRDKFGTLDSTEKTIAILGDRWWPKTAKQKGDPISKTFLCDMFKKRYDGTNVGRLYLEQERCSVSKGMRGK